MTALLMGLILEIVATYKEEIDRWSACQFPRLDLGNSVVSPTTTLPLSGALCGLVLPSQELIRVDIVLLATSMSLKRHKTVSNDLSISRTWVTLEMDSSLATSGLYLEVKTGKAACGGNPLSYRRRALGNGYCMTPTSL